MLLYVKLPAVVVSFLGGGSFVCVSARLHRVLIPSDGRHLADFPFCCPIV